MKKIVNCILTVVIVMFACNNQNDEIYPGQQVVFDIVEVNPDSIDKSDFSFEYKNDNGDQILKSASAEIVINGITYSSKLCYNNNILSTDIIQLESEPNQLTTYSVSKFIIKTANGNIIKVNPEKNAEYAQYVEEAIPFQLKTNSSSKIKTKVDVLSYHPANCKKYGFDNNSIHEVVVRQKCFFCDVCINPINYEGSAYENQRTGLQVDVPAIIQMVVKKNDIEVEGSPFTNATDEMGWGVGQPLCVTYPDDLNIQGEEFIFEMYILFADGFGGFDYELCHTFMATDDGPLDISDFGNDGVIDFVLGECVYNDPDNPSIDLKLARIEPNVECETAFAYNEETATCFLDLEEINNNRWGWTNGPFSENEHSYQFRIYAGAAQCDISKGTLVGSLSLYYSDGEANLTFNMKDGFSLNEVHLYFGNEILPLDKKGNQTVTVGKYPHIIENLDGSQTYSYTFDDLSGNVYMVAHAVVCGVYSD